MYKNKNYSDRSVFIETFLDSSGCLIIQEIMVVIFYAEKFRISDFAIDFGNSIDWILSPAIPHKSPNVDLGVCFRINYRPADLRICETPRITENTHGKWKNNLSLCEDQRESCSFTVPL